MNDQAVDYSPIDAFHVGRRRKPNFTDHEVLNIIDQYDLYKELLHSREASKSVIAQKQAIWRLITENLNHAYPQVERTVEDVRRKWKKLQSEAKREVAAYRAAQQAGSNTPISTRQMTFYNRIISICRPSNATAAAAAAAANTSHFATNLVVPLHHHAAFQLPANMINGHSNNTHEQFSDKIDSPSSDLANGQLDSPGDESASLLGNDDTSPSPATSVQPTSLSTFVTSQASIHPTSMTSNGQVSKRTLDKQRKQIKASRPHQPMNTNSNSVTMNPKLSGRHHTSLRYESLTKRKRTLDLTSQQLICDKECLLLERKNLELKLAVNENEHERINIEKRRVESALQKCQYDTPPVINGNTNNHYSDVEDHDGNNSLDEMSDINE